jgi:hypothetical protein
MFAEEKPVLQPLPIEPFRCYAFGKRPVHLDGCAEIVSAYHAPPPGRIGREIHAQWASAWCASSTPRPASSCASTCAGSAAAELSIRRIGRARRRRPPSTSSPAPDEPGV